MKETMIVHKALSELKVLDNRINNEIYGATFIVGNKHSNKKIDGKEINTYKDSLKSTYQKINDLIARRNAIKRAVSKSNAETMVTINNVEYSIATAIEMKNHGIELKKELLDRMKSQFSQVKTSTTTWNDSLQGKADTYVTNIFGAKDKVDPKVVDEARKTYIEANTLDIIDPLIIDKEIDKLTTEIDAFESEVDSALSVSNATTVLEVEY